MDITLIQRLGDLLVREVQLEKEVDNIYAKLRQIRKEIEAIAPAPLPKPTTCPEANKVMDAAWTVDAETGHKRLIDRITGRVIIKEA